MAASARPRAECRTRPAGSPLSRPTSASNWNNPWRIPTEHFEIRADVPLGEAIGFARRLEHFYDLFFALIADVVGENFPLARRFRSTSPTAEVAYRPHQVDYFASKDEYVEHLRASVGVGIQKSLGYYNPPSPVGATVLRLHFFRDLGGQLAVTATLYHEVSHQLLFETAGPNAYTKNIGELLGLRGPGDLLRDGRTSARRLARGRRPGRRGSGGTQVVRRTASSCPCSHSSGSIRMRSTETTGST